MVERYCIKIIDGMELLHQKQSKFVFSEPPLHWLMTSSTNHVLENHSGLWSNIVYILVDHKGQDIDTDNDTAIL